MYTADPLTDDIAVVDLLSDETRLDAYAAVGVAFAGDGDPQELRRVAGEMAREIASLPDAVQGAVPVYAVDDHVIAHAVHSTLYALLIAAEGGVPEAQRMSLAMGMLVHDIGTRNLSEVLSERGELSPGERAETRLHTREGFEMLSELLNRSPLGRSIALLHHERLDGSGYPRGLSGDDLPLLARVGAVADVFAAVISDRPHRPGAPPDEAISYFLAGAPEQFDRDCIVGLARRVEIYPTGMWVRLRDGRCGIVLGSRRGSTVRPVVRLLQDERRRPLRTPLDVDLARETDLHIADVFLN